MSADCGNIGRRRDERRGRVALILWIRDLPVEARYAHRQSAIWKNSALRVAVSIRRAPSRFADKDDRRPALEQRDEVTGSGECSRIHKDKETPWLPQALRPNRPADDGVG